MFLPDDLFGAYDYPTTTAELIEQHADDVLELANGSETLGEILEIVGPETFQAAADLRYTVYGAVSSKAIGRRFYTDRESMPPGTYGPEPESF